MEKMIEMAAFAYGIVAGQTLCGFEILVLSAFIIFVAMQQLKAEKSDANAEDGISL